MSLITPEFNVDEVRQRFAPDGSELRAFQKDLLDIVRYIVDICESNHLTYWLSGGTLLGACLYEGFIPWDDDVDIDMPRSDYLKLRRIIIADGVYKWQDKSTDAFYPYYYAKVRNEAICRQDDTAALRFSKYKGMFVDIIPVEKCNRWAKKNSFKVLCGGFYKLMCLADNNWFFRMIQSFRRGFNEIVLFVFRAVSALDQKALYMDTYAVGDSRCHRIHSMDDFQDVLFEGIVCKAPRNVDEYLSEWYPGADYRKLPDLSDVSKYQHYKW